MANQSILLLACGEASETWHYMTRECEAFNKDSAVETAGQMTRSLLTFGTSALIGIPEIQRRIEGHIIRLEKSLYELQKRVSRCVSLASEGENPYELLIEVERRRFGAQGLLTCGLIDNDSGCEYRCNIGEVSFHLVEARSFWRSANNPVQDIAMRHKMVCKSRRLLEASVATPKLAAMPHIPLSQKLKDYISSQIKTQVESIDDLAATAIQSLKEASQESPFLQKLLAKQSIEAIKKAIDYHPPASGSGQDPASQSDGN